MMPKQIISRAILVVFFTMTYIFMNAQCSILLSNPNQPLINIVTNASCQAEFNAAPYVTQVGQNCTLKYFKDQALTMPYPTAIPAFTSSNLGQQITIYVTVDDNDVATPLPAPISFVVRRSLHREDHDDETMKRFVRTLPR